MRPSEQHGIRFQPPYMTQLLIPDFWASAYAQMAEVALERHYAVDTPAFLVGVQYFACHLL